MVREREREKEKEREREREHICTCTRVHVCVCERERKDSGVGMSVCTSACVLQPLFLVLDVLICFSLSLPPTVGYTDQQAGGYQQQSAPQYHDTTGYGQPQQQPPVHQQQWGTY